MTNEDGFQFGEDRRGPEEIPEDDDPLVIDDLRKAVIIQQWRNSRAIALGDLEMEEWIVADPKVCINLARVR